MKDVLARWVCLVAVGLPLLAAAQEEEGTGEERTQSVLACGFDGAGPEARGQLVDSTREECGASMCITFGELRIGLEGEEPLLEVLRDSGLQPGSHNRLPDLGVECAPGKLTLRVPEPPGVPAVVLEYRSGRFVFAQGLLEELERAWESPTGGPWEFEALRALGGLLSELDEVDAGPSQSVRLLQARRLLRAVRWDPAESLLQTLSQESLAPGIEARHQALSQALRQARAQSVPLRVAEWKRLGTVLDGPQLPPWYEGALPTVFWKGTQLCVAQEDASPPQHMRCYETKTGRWSERVPFALPPGSPAGLESRYGGRVCLYAENCWHPGLPELEDMCGGFACNEVWALAPGPVILTAGEKGVHAFTSKGERELEPGQASELLSKSSGSRMAGGSRYVWGQDGKLRPVSNLEQSWEVLGESPPPDKKQAELVRWGGLPLASPDQQWVLRVAGGEQGPKVLWLARLAPVKR